MPTAPNIETLMLVLVAAAAVFLGLRAGLLILSLRTSRLARNLFDRAEARARRKDLLDAQILFGLGKGLSHCAHGLTRAAQILRPYFF